MTLQTHLQRVNLQKIQITQVVDSLSKSSPLGNRRSHSSRYAPPWSHKGRISSSGEGCDLNGRCSRSLQNRLFEPRSHYPNLVLNFCLKLEIPLFCPQSSRKRSRWIEFYIEDRYLRKLSPSVWYTQGKTNESISQWSMVAPFHTDILDKSSIDPQVSFEI